MTSVGIATKVTETPPNFDFKRTTTYAYVESVDRYGDGALISLGLWTPSKNLEAYKDSSEIEPNEVFSLQVDAKKLRKKYLTDHRGFKEGLWLEVQFNRQDGYSIIGESQFQTVRFIRKLSNKTIENKKLRKLFAFVLPPPEFQLTPDSDFIVNFEAIDGLAQEQVGGIPTYPNFTVYDIGQGLCSSLNRADGTPYSYFDFGDGLYGTAKRKFLTTQRCKLVVLSHWHADHYNSYINNIHALNVPWLVPYHAVLSPPAHMLMQRLQTYYVMRNHINSLNFPFFTVTRVAGAPRAGNNSGYAVVIELTRADRSNARIFIPGDADYRAINHAPAGAVDCLVATHHGANVHGGHEPRPANGEGLIIYSAATTRVPNHPRDHQVQIYNGLGWNRRAHTIHGDIKVGLNQTPLVVALLQQTQFLI